jgi:CRISPR-associated endoribonuclease Cas6
MVHEKEGYKFFSLSNIFPIKDIEEDDFLNLIIASPNKELVASLEGIFQKFVVDQKRMNIGEMSFVVKNCKKLDTRLTRGALRVLTATPVIIRIPERNYERYEILEEERKPRYVYRRPKYSFEASLKQLSEVTRQNTEAP